MADSPVHFEHLDQLLADLGTALAREDWEELARLNASVKPTVEPLMVALEAGEVEADLVRQRLEELQQFVDAANESAPRARSRAESELRDVTRNRSAARAYQNVSSDRPK